MARRPASFRFVSLATLALAALSAAAFSAFTLAPAPALAQRAVGAARPVPPPIPARIVTSQCSYGGAVPAIVVVIEIEAIAAVTGLGAATLYLRTPSGRMLSGVRGALTLRTRPATPPGVAEAPPAPFDGRLAAGQRLRLEVFGMLETAAFGRSSYPNTQLPFELALTAGPAVLRVRGGPCRITPAG